MKAKMLKIAGVKSEKEFYKKYPTEEAFMKAHGKAFKKAQIGTFIGGETGPGFQPISFKDVYDSADYAITGATGDQRREEAYRQAELAAAQSKGDGGGGLGGMLQQLPQLLGQVGGGAGAAGATAGAALGAAKKGKNIKKAQLGNNTVSTVTPINLQPNSRNNYAWTNFNTQPAPVNPDRPAQYNTQTQGTPVPQGEIVPIGGMQLGVKEGNFTETLGKFAGPAGKLVQGFQQLRDEKRALQRAEQATAVSDLVKQAASTRPEQTKRRYVRPEDVVNTGEEFFPIYGVGTNVLAKNGAEITNTFAPNTIYDDLGYEPLNNNQRYKQFYHGGKMHKAQDGFLTDFANAGGGDMMSQLMTGVGGENAGGNIGGTIGQVAGNLIAPGVGGTIGQVGGQLIGSLLDRKPQKIKKAKAATEKNIQAIALQQGMQGGQSQYTSFMENGGTASPYGWMSHTWQPQVITTFGEHNVKDLLKAPKDADMLRSGGHLKEYTPPSASALSTERPMMEEGGELQTHWGGYAEPMSYNPFLPDGGETIMFRGQSHEESDGKGNTGIGITYGNSPVEVERGEPAIKLRDGSSGDSSLVVFGNLKIPDTLLGDPKAKGKNFKKYVAELSEKENKINKLVDKSVNQLDSFEIEKPIDRLKFNALQANIKGSNMKLKDIAEKKMNASALQTAMNDTIEEYGLKTTDKGNVIAKLGASIEKAQNGARKYKKIAKTPGYVDYNPIGTEDVEDFKSESSYKNVWLPKVESAFSNPETAKQLVERLENYTGQDAADVVNLIKKGKTFEEKVRIAKKYASDFKPGPYHELVRNLIVPKTPAPPSPEQPVAPQKSKFPEIPVSPIKSTEPKEEEVLIESKKPDWMTYFNQVLPYLRPSDVEELDPRQLMGEMYALATNQLEPVQAQTLQPQLDVPYDISLQDQLNENEATFRAQQRLMGYNPAAQAQLNAQKYQANQRVLGEQFRMNQAKKDQVYSSNRNLLNQFNLQNLAILDKQYERQAAAKSATKATTLEALKSIGDKYLQNQLENRTLATMENMYNYRYDPRFRAINMNPLVDFDAMIANASPSELEQFQKSLEKKSKKDQTGRNGSIVKAFRNI